MVSKVLVQTSVDDNDNMLHVFRGGPQNTVGAAIQTGHGVFKVTGPNGPQLLRANLSGNITHRYSSTTDDPSLFLKQARQAVQAGETDNKRVLQRSGTSHVKEGHGAIYTVASIAAVGLGLAQMVEMTNVFMADGVLTQLEAIELGVNALERIPGSIVDVVQAAFGEGDFIDDLLAADEVPGITAHAIDGTVNFLKSIFA